MTRLAEEFASLWGLAFGRIRPRDEREERDERTPEQRRIDASRKQ